MDYFVDLFKSTDFMPHGHCYMWQTDVLWANIIGDSLTAVSYYIIPFLLIYFNKKRSVNTLRWALWLFGAFIFFCGTTHVIEIITIWVPSYRFSSLVKVLTGIVSIATTIYLIKILPIALKIPSPEELKEVNLELGQFAYTVAHDMRSPLRHIAICNRILESSASEKLDENEKEQIKNIQSISTDLGQMIDELLDYTKSEKKEVEFSLLNTNRLVDEVIQEFDDETTDRSIEWQVDDLPEILGDEVLVKSILRNLIGNAIKYTSQKELSHIKLTASSSKGSTEFTLKDNGIGFDMKYYDKLFKPFERLTTDPLFKGHGIGLAHVYRILSKHGGYIKAESAEGEGATFRFSFNK